VDVHVCGAVGTGGELQAWCCMVRLGEIWWWWWWCPCANEGVRSAGEVGPGGVEATSTALDGHCVGSVEDSHSVVGEAGGAPRGPHPLCEASTIGLLYAW